jgi:hypothetical protein
VDGDVGLTALAGGDVDAARVDLGPARGHALDRQLELLGRRGPVVDADDQARIRAGLDDDLRRLPGIRARGRAQLHADGVSMPSCRSFSEHLNRC